MRPAVARPMSGLVLVCGALFATAALGATASLASGTAPVSDGVAYTEQGQASWYGPRHEGRRTTSGETFDSSKLTAAHASLPMGSFVRVTVQQTGRSIVVKVNDREPPHGVRCIDLSREAATRLGMIGRGVADVTLAQVDPSEATELAEAPDETADGSATRRATARRGRRHTHRARR